MKKITFYLAVLVSLNLSSQTFAWVKQIGGPNNENTMAMVADALGNVYLTGYFDGTTDFDPGAGVFNLTTVGSSDIFVCKLDASGNFVWAKRMGGTGNDQPRSIALDASGNVYTTGAFNSTDADFDPGAGTYTLSGGGFNGDAFVSKLDASGNFVWASQFSGPGDQSGQDLTIDASGNILVTGIFENTVDFDPGVSTFTLTAAQFDAFVVKLDASGNFIWAKQFGGANGDDGACIVTDVSGNIYSAGNFDAIADFDPGAGSYTLATFGATDIYISKLDASGNFVWAKQMGGTSYDEATDIKLDPSNNVCVVGNFQSTVDLDPGVASLNFTSAGMTDFFISKLNATGNLVWARAFGGANDDRVNSLAIDGVGNFYTTGAFQSTSMDMDPGAGTFTLSSGIAGVMEIFISRLDGSGNFSWAGSCGANSEDDLGSAITLDASGNSYVSGYFSSPAADFDPGVGTVTLNPTGADVFVLKLSSTLSGISESYLNGNNVQLSPNPTSGIVMLTKEASVPGKIEIYNCLGSLIYSSHLSAEASAKAEIDLTQQPNGIYFIRIGTVTKKIVKE